MSEARAVKFEEDTDETKLPAGWVEASLGAFLPLSYGKALPARARDNYGKFPVYGSSGTVGFHSAHIAPENSIIVGRKGTAGAVYFSGAPSWPIDTAYFATPPSGFEPRYWFFQLQALQLGRLDQSTAIPSLSRSNYNPISVRVPPSNEQKRIVSKIDELFSDIEAGERALQRARAALARYRKSVLKAAVTGALTADWREANKDTLEHADKLLARILNARREAWEKAERSKLKAKDKETKGDAWKKKYKDPAEYFATSEFEMPNNWSWASLDSISWDSSYGTSAKCGYDFTGVAVLRIPNVRAGNINYKDIKFATGDSTFVEVELVSQGDLLIVRTNGSAEIIGLGGVVDKPPINPTYFASYLIRFRLLPSEPKLASWINVVWQSETVRAQIRAHAATSAGQYNVSQSNMARFAIPIPPSEEQSEIVSRVEEAFSKADHVEAALDEQERAARALKQSILKAAFEGRLVPQDPADEPAAKLLERIRKAKGK